MRNLPISPLLPVYKRAPVTFERGEGAYLFDQEGRRYLDFGSGVAVTLLGHNHPHLVQALKHQGERLWHCSNLYHNEPQDRLAARLVASSFADAVFFCNSGAEALECTIKMARRFHHQRGQEARHEILTFKGAFHGRTLGTISAAAAYLDGFLPALPGFINLPGGDLAAVEAAAGPRSAAILVEPIQGESGIRVFDPEFLRALRRLADERDILLIFDEVQTGMGRTGRLFACQGFGVQPDLMALAKGLGGGFPIGACLASARVASAMSTGSHGSTFGGNPLACAVANAVLDVLQEDGFLARVEASGERLKIELDRLKDAYPDVIREVRGKGLMLGLRLADKIAAGPWIEDLLRQGLVLIPAGDNVARILPPLIIGETEIEEAVGLLEAHCRNSRAALVDHPIEAAQ